MSFMGKVVEKVDSSKFEISSATVLPMVTVPLMDEITLTNGAEVERWDAYNKHILMLLLLSTKCVANSFPRPLCREAQHSRRQSDEQVAWKAMTDAQA